MTPITPGTLRLCERCGSLFTPTPESEEQCPRCLHARWWRLAKATRPGTHHRSPAESLRRARDGEHSEWRDLRRRPVASPQPVPAPMPAVPAPPAPSQDRYRDRQTALLEIFRQAPGSWWTHEELYEEGFHRTGGRKMLDYTLARLIRDGLVEWAQFTGRRPDGLGGKLRLQYRLRPDTQEAPDGE